MAEIQAGYQVLPKLCKALGLEGRSVRRIILDVAIGGVPTLYVEGYVEKTHADELMQVLPDLGLDVSNAADVSTQAGFKVAIRAGGVLP